jgi:hypothetical protein
MTTYELEILATGSAAPGIGKVPKGESTAPAAMPDDALGDSRYSVALVTDDPRPCINIIAMAAAEKAHLYVNDAQVPAHYDPLHCELIPDDPLPDGLHEFAYWVEDAAGNMSSISRPIVIVIDTSHRQ